ncbi:P27 family phage terminase small subunit [Iodobacter sp. CM08]|uniref:P27 family phage terminase small subunit n=1 Tax=Iodobacter sp. CM08 TaxID=3085902 RepID=UPI00298270E4|nr:P27 family phage terminase small subunit [Iodobacter sp. CM08]MDW5417734.1 P27 family phage terminase small subunit [Iodobacter sp. CM08]
MSQERPPFAVIQGGIGKSPLVTVGEVISPAKPPGEMNTQERRVWDYICERLREAGIDHGTFGLAAMVVCKTYIHWIQAESELAKIKDSNFGSYLITTPNGFSQPHQIFYVVSALKKELLQWLPECALTIPSLSNIRSKTGDQSQQDDLFGNLVNHAANRPSAFGH